MIDFLIFYRFDKIKKLNNHYMLTKLLYKRSVCNHEIIYIMEIRVFVFLLNYKSGCLSS